MSRAACACAAFLALAALLLAARPAAAQAIGDAPTGQRLAATWCGACHITAREAPGPASDPAPSFAAIAAMPSTTEMSLRAFLQTPHRLMPDYKLTRRETDDLVAYILSQRRP